MGIGLASLDGSVRFLLSFIVSLLKSKTLPGFTLRNLKLSLMGSEGERVAKRVAYFERLVSAGKISRQEADRRERESRLAIMRSSVPVVAGPSKGGQKPPAVRKSAPKKSGSAGEVILPAPEATTGPWDFPTSQGRVVSGFDLWNTGFWEPASHFNNVSLVSVVVRVVCPLAIDGQNFRAVFAFSESSYTATTTFAQIRDLKGNVVIRGDKLEGVHTLTPPAGSARAIRRGGKEVKVEGVVKKLFFVWAVEKAASSTPAVSIKVTARYSAGGGPRVVTKTSL